VEFLGDFHTHSRFSRATSRDLSLPDLHGWAQRKGITVVGTGDFVHPEWMAEMREMLIPAGEGLFRLRDDVAALAEEDVPPSVRNPVRFLLTGEIANIYKQDGKTRKIHSVVFSPGLECADRIHAALARVGNLKSDGRPILGISAKDLLEVVLEAGDGAFVVPAHIWTPWFSLLGHRSGFDSVEACYQDLTRHIFAVETGLSADPPMCRRLSILDGLTLISNSDAHSGRKLGREANVFDTDLDFPSIRQAWESGDREKFKGTLEFYPEEGKYHFDGHRKCNLRMNPAETLECGGVCPVCGNPVTIGVMSRVEELADREGGSPKGEDPYQMIVPLVEIIGEVMEVNSGAKRVRIQYEALLERCGPELEILRSVPLEDIERASTPMVAEAIRRMREGEMSIAAGYDGEFGTIRIFAPGERARLAGQGTLFVVPEMENEQRNPDPPRKSRSGRSLAGKDDGEPAFQAPAICLNDAQQAAVDSPAGPLLILAGPGTGKTRTLTHRIAHRVISGEVPPEAVLAVTFTNRAAREMRERLAAQLSGTGILGKLTVTTFHALGLKVLREETREAGLKPGFRIMDLEERDDMIKHAFGKKVTKSSLVRARKKLEVEAGLSSTNRAEVSVLRKRYEAAKREENVVDFDDLVQRPLELFHRCPETACRWRSRYRFISIDEYQDLNPAQYELLTFLVPPGGDITVIGDPEQAIYGFRGADPDFFLHFEKDHAGARVVRLTRNYRSTEQIISAATQVIARSPIRWETRLWSGIEGDRRISMREESSPKGEAAAVVREIERLVGGTSEFSLDSDRIDVAEAGRGYGFSDIAVLYRLSALRQPLEKALNASGMPYQVAGHEAALDQPGIRKAVEKLRSLKPKPGVAVAEQVEHTVSNKNLADCLAAFALPFGDDMDGFLDQITLGSGVDLYDPRAERITLMTLHASKGIEFPVVFIVGCEEGILPFSGLPASGDHKGAAPELLCDLEEERRLFYVGMTRAKSCLYLSRALKRTLFGKTTPGRPSRFLKDIDETLKQVEKSRTSAGARRKQADQKTLF